MSSGLQKGRYFGGGELTIFTAWSPSKLPSAHGFFWNFFFFVAFLSIQCNVKIVHTKGKKIHCVFHGTKTRTWHFKSRYFIDRSSTTVYKFQISILLFLTLEKWIWEFIRKNKKDVFRHLTIIKNFWKLLNKMESYIVLYCSAIFFFVLSLPKQNVSLESGTMPYAFLTSP